MSIYIFNLYFVLIMLYMSRSLSAKRISDDELEWKRHSKISGMSSFLIILAFCSMVLISGLRHNVGTDYYEYVIIFKYLALHDGVWFGFQIEPVFVLLIKAIAIFSNNSVWIFMLTSFFTIYFVFKASVKSCKLYDLAIFLFIAFGFYTSSLNIVRQWMAASVLLYAYTFLANKQHTKFFKYVLLACCCHYSALVVFPVYLFINKPRKDITRIFLMMIGVILFNATNYIVTILRTVSLNVPVLNKYYKLLTLNENIGSSVFVFPMFCVLTYLLYALLIRRNKQKTDRIEIYMNILSTGFVFSLIGQKLMIFNRLQFFFIIVLIIIIPQIACLLKKKEVPLFYLACILIGTIFMVYSLIQNGGQPLPYQTIFS